MEDKKIIELFFKRDEEAIHQVMKKYQNYCFSIGKNILDNSQDVLEVLNDVYLALWDSIPPQCPESLSAYLGKITRNLSLSKYRYAKAKKRNGGMEEVSFNELEECIPDTFFKKNCSQILLTDAINDFLSTLSNKDRHVFVCRYWYFDSIKDISKRYLISESNVKMSLKRNREKLKEYLVKEGFSNE